VGHEPAALLDHPEHGPGIGMAESLELGQAIKIDKLLQNEPDVTEWGNVTSHGLRVSPAKRKSPARPYPGRQVAGRTHPFCPGTRARPSVADRTSPAVSQSRDGLSGTWMHPAPTSTSPAAASRLQPRTPGPTPHAGSSARMP